MASLRDRDLKDQLLRMAEWDHGARHGWDRETWRSDGRVREWMDEDILVALDDCWADFSLPAMRRALRASVALFDTLEIRTADALGIEAFDGRAVRQEVERILGSPRIPGHLQDA